METLAICRQLALARADFREAIAEKPTGRFMIRSCTRVVKRHLEGIISGSRSAIAYWSQEGSFMIHTRVLKRVRGIGEKRCQKL